MKKVKQVVVSVMVLAGLLAGCGNTANDASSNGSAPDAPENQSTREDSSSSAPAPITVVSREDGSGTRGAFIELFGIEQKDADGNKVDYTTQEANITNSTSVMMSTVSGDPNAIGYISLGSLGNTVKAVEIDGAAATVENIKNGSYKIARPFNIATSGEVSAVAEDFIAYILSEDGQSVVEANGYISAENSGAYTASNLEGKIVVAGSSSVTPVMEKLKEAYVALNPSVTIEIQQSDSTTGMTSAIEGICDIGMASRDIKDSELEKGLSGQVIAMDGIAVIVNHDNSVDALTSEQVLDIFTGNAVEWGEIA